VDPARGKKGSHPIADQVDEGMGRPREEGGRRGQGWGGDGPNRARGEEYRRKVEREAAAGYAPSWKDKLGFGP